ncbi:N-methylhydantoinase A [Azospirillum agricola]|uniref:hydantoinase/oxoprolinase family protein n=1 Tax=Azospirillum agricola TaxID=1720247 RepID=UPI001AEA15FD|nr:hydantoinase/oxoprolinase family protein [Azospirillum agricola]MBP2231907.1 N-methylhydantoinase A [Azospirillum agricola]
MHSRIGFDVGGTFTDFVLHDAATREIRCFKLPSTPHDPSEAIGAGLSQILAPAEIGAGGIEPSRIGRIGHGTTVATNLVIERKGARTGLLTTRGFRDVLEIGRQTRPHLYDATVRRPPPLVSRANRIEIDERVLADGTVLIPLDRAGVERAARRLAAAGVEAVAVCFLHSYRFPGHEREARDILRTILPDAYVSLSSDVLPEFREFERLSTTVLNAAVGPRMGGYLDRFLAAVRRLGIAAEPHTVHSNGGLMSAAAVRELPVRTCLSGPAAGVVGSAEIGRAAGFPDLITFDVGGTSTDVSLVADGRPLFTSERLIAGYPVKTPMVDIHVIGAGGGSIAALDEGGALKVGPRSAGAVPGPAAYGRGGSEPTITDANIALGRLDPAALLGGQLAVDADAARDALRRRVAVPLGLPLEEAAHGIIRIANATMSRAIRSISTERGHDARRFALFAYGGAGPLHAGELAQDCGIRTVLVPQEPGTLCARGILLSDVSMDFVRSVMELTDPAGWPGIAAGFAALRRDAALWLGREGIAPAERRYRHTIDARFQGQNFEIPVPIDDPEATGPDPFLARFRTIHRQTHGYDIAGRAVEIVNLRVQAIGPVERIAWTPPPAAGSPGDALKAHRRVYFGGGDGWLDVPVFDRAGLPAGTRIDEPCVVEEMSSTTLVLPRQSLGIDPAGNLVITLA